MRYGKLYWIWNTMKGKCQNPNHDSYEHYGGRGIYVCDRWQDYDNFEVDMGPTYSPGLTLERIDNDGPYSPENCRWATYKEQGRNKRNNRYLDTPWGLLTIAEAAQKLGVKQRPLYKRADRNWSDGEIISNVDHLRRADP